MTNYVQSTNLSRSDYHTAAIDGGDYYHLVEGVSVLATGTYSGMFATGDYNRIEIRGSLYGTLSGISVSGIYNNIYVSDSGSVSSNGTGAIYSTGNQTAVVNAGDISGPTAVYLTGSSNRVSNSGSIVGTDAYGGQGMLVTGSASVINSGYIFGAYAAVRVDNGLDLTNSGNIESSVYAIATGNLSDTIINNGSIVGAVSLGGRDDVFDSSEGRVRGRIEGGLGNDTLTGGISNEVFFGGGGADTIDGGGGINTASYGDHTGSTGVIVNLLTGTATGGPASGDLLINIRNVAGSGARDFLTGDARNNVLDGDSGNDVLDGGAGNDTLRGSSGNNVLNGGSGRDTLVIRFGDNDSVNGGDGDDRILVGQNLNGLDRLNGGAGTDNLVLDASPGGLMTFTFAAATMVNVEALTLERNSDYTLRTADANVAAGQSLRVDGGSLGYGDVLTFNGAAETNGQLVLVGGDGADVLTGGAGADFLVGGYGADRLRGSAGSDTFFYRATNDSLPAVDNLDVITGADFLADKFDFPVTVDGIKSAVRGGSLSEASFATDLEAALGAAQLGIRNAVRFEPDAGTLAGRKFMVVEAGGGAGYQRYEDYVVELVSPQNATSISVGDFI